MSGVPVRTGLAKAIIEGFEQYRRGRGAELATFPRQDRLEKKVYNQKETAQLHDFVGLILVIRPVIKLSSTQISQNQAVIKLCSLAL